MNEDELELLTTLDSLVFQPDALAAIRRLADDLIGQLDGKPAASFARGELPLPLFGPKLPAGLRSSNVYVIRPSVSSGIERHPNSHQRSMSLQGSGRFVVGSPGRSISHELPGEPAGRVLRRWVSIPPQTWHEAVAGNGLWTVVTFHTATEREIINERLAPPGAAGQGVSQ